MATRSRGGPIFRLSRSKWRRTSGKQPCLIPTCRSLAKYRVSHTTEQFGRQISGSGNAKKARGVVLTHKNSQAARASCGSLTIPAELILFSEPSFLLPGENLGDFEAIRQMLIDDIQPETNIEWLWTLDLVELSWEILRYRCLKQRILDVHRAAAIEVILQRLDGEGMPAEAMPMVRIQARRTATEWRADSEAATEIEARLDRSGFDP